MAQAAHALPSLDANGNDRPSLPSPKSFDFGGQHELDWDRIEMEIHSIARRAKAVEMVGRTAQDNIHGEKLGEVFDFLASDISGDIERLKELLGIGREDRP
jgi:hypothetical protein